MQTWVNFKYLDTKVSIQRQLNYFKGDVPAVTEVTGDLNAVNTEIVQGLPTQAKFQFNVETGWSKLFDIVNDPIPTVIIFLLIQAVML